MAHLHSARELTSEQMGHVTPFPAADCMQARQEGTLDDLVVSLQSRREMFDSLDLIPPQYTYKAARAAVQEAPLGATEPVPELLPGGTKRHLPDAVQQRGHKRQEHRLLSQVHTP
jgi:hypothetical protein